MDDLVIGVEHLVDINKVKSLLSSKFEMTDMKELHYFLHIEVIRTPAGIMISQQHYILNSLYKFGMTECTYVATPLDRNLKLDANSIDNWLIVSSTSRSLDPTSSIRLTSLANSCKLHKIFILIVLSECYDT